jgi:hypothetical protein
MTRCARFVVLAATSGAALACSSSTTNTSLVGTWNQSSAATYVFNPDGSCEFFAALGGQDYCSTMCTYEVSGSSLTMTTISVGNTGSPVSNVCTYGLTFSNGGKTLEIRSTGGPACPTLDVTLTRDPPDPSFAIHCGG